MSIIDTCPCGAKVDIAFSYTSHEDSRHDVWLAAHAVCREVRYDQLVELMGADDIPDDRPRDPRAAMGAA